MKCPECVRENKKSKVYPGMMTRTAIYYPPYYDEYGKIHDPDRNITTVSYSCSRGHKWEDQKEFFVGVNGLIK